MKIGFSTPKTDLSVKHIFFELDGEKHLVTFRLTCWSGIQDVMFDSRRVKIIDAYPSMVMLIKESASIILHDLHFIIGRMFVRNKRGRNQST